LLLQFARNAGKTLTAEELLRNVWGPEYSEEKEILWVSISRLRQKLEKDPKNPELIVTHSGEGYMMP
jgi:two-component system KDP operon response regulator KdpE